MQCATCSIRASGADRTIIPVEHREFCLINVRTGHNELRWARRRTLAASEPRLSHVFHTLEIAGRDPGFGAAVRPPPHAPWAKRQGNNSLQANVAPLIQRQKWVKGGYPHPAFAIEMPVCSTPISGHAADG